MVLVCQGQHTAGCQNDINPSKPHHMALGKKMVGVNEQVSI